MTGRTVPSLDLDDGTEEIGWAILELMGHRKLAGYVRETTIGGAPMLRIDVCVPQDGSPLHESDVGFIEDRDGAPLKVIATQFYSGSSVYCLTPSTRDMCLQVARGRQPAPVQRWELPAPEPDRDVDDLEDAEEVPYR